METEVTLSVDPYSPPIWEGLGVELNILSEQTPRLTNTNTNLKTDVRNLVRTGES